MVLFLLPLSRAADFSFFVPIAKFGLECSLEREQGATGDDFVNYATGKPTGNLYHV